MTQKKSFFQKLGLVESTEPSIDERLLQYGAQSQYQFEEEVEVLPEINLGDEDFLLVDQVYEKAGLQDMEQSIFKVDEISKVLPSSLPTDVKRTTVVGMLTVSNLTVDVLVEDADNRILALKSVKQATTDNTESVVATNEAKIAELLLEVDSLKQQNNDRKTAQESQDTILNDEITRVTEIKKFVSPESV